MIVTLNVAQLKTIIREEVKAATDRLIDVDAARGNTQRERILALSKLEASPLLREGRPNREVQRARFAKVDRGTKKVVTKRSNA